jgi:hypothetical protein
MDLIEQSSVADPGYMKGLEDAAHLVYAVVATMGQHADAASAYRAVARMIDMVRCPECSPAGFLGRPSLVASPAPCTHPSIVSWLAPELSASTESASQ